MNFKVIGCMSSNKMLDDFGGDLDHGADPRILRGIFTVVRDRDNCVNFVNFADDSRSCRRAGCFTGNRPFDSGIF